MFHERPIRFAERGDLLWAARQTNNPDQGGAGLLVSQAAENNSSTTLTFRASRISSRCSDWSRSVRTVSQWTTHHGLIERNVRRAAPRFSRLAAFV